MELSVSMQEHPIKQPRLRSLIPRSLSPARANLVAAARSARFTLRDLSLKLDRNPSYLQNFLAKGSPRHLPEQLRYDLARLLQVDHTTLSDVALEPPLPAERATAAETSRSILTWLEGHAPEQRPLSISLPHAGLILRLSRPRGILQPRHIILCDERSNPSAGDLVAVMGGNEVAAVGLLVPSRTAEISVLEASEYVSFPAGTHRILRIAAILDR